MLGSRRVPSWPGGKHGSGVQKKSPFISILLWRVQDEALLEGQHHGYFWVVTWVGLPCAVGGGSGGAL